MLGEPRLVVVEADVAVVDRRHPVLVGSSWNAGVDVAQPRRRVRLEDAGVEPRERNVLSTPKSTSPSGLSFVRIAWFTIAPASPALQHLHGEAGLLGESVEQAFDDRERVVREQA